jgi:DNA-binding MarR family transcriptional regulator/N-acetylglutamate synthase-like GNAT family acetyltransferase
MDDAVAAVRAFNRFHTRFVGALDAHYLDTDLSLAEARLLYEVATRAAPLASELQAELGLDAGYTSRILRRFEERGWIERGRGEDARRRPINLTSAGREAFASLDARSRDGVAARLEALPPANRATLIAALDAVTGLLSGQDAPWSIRHFRIGDLHLLASRQSVIYQDYGWGRPMEVLQGEVVTAFLKNFREGREQCWIAERAGAMAGSVFLAEVGEDVGQLRMLYVEPWARGLGIGQALVAECVGFARSAGYGKVRLWTHTVLESARRIYRAAGFELVATETHHEFGKPEQGETWELALTR